MVTPSDMVEWLNAIHDGRIVEVRALGIGRNGKGVASGYFDDYEKAVEAALQLDAGGAEGVYQTLNEVHPGCIARSPNQITENPRVTTTDSDIVQRRWGLIDIDPVRPSGISATDEEINNARSVFDTVAGSVFGETIEAFSGNGWHLLFRPQPPFSSDEHIQSLLRNASELCDWPGVATVDQSVWNLARITKFYGTHACKGFAVADRPHRQSYVFQINDREQEAVQDDSGFTEYHG